MRRPFICYRFCRIAFSCILFFVISASAGAQTFDIVNPASAATQQKMVATYQAVKSNLLTIDPEPFVIDNKISVENFKAVQKQIYKGNLKEVRNYLLNVFKNPEALSNTNLKIAAKNTWIEYLISIDSFNAAYSEAIPFILFADSAHVPESGYAYLITARAAFYANDYATINSNLDKALECARKTNNIDLEGKTQLVGGMVARKYFYGFTGRAQPYYDRAITAAEKAKDTITLIRAYMLRHSDKAEAGDVEGGFPPLAYAIQLCMAGKYLRTAPNLCENLYIDLYAIGKLNEAADIMTAAIQYTKCFGNQLLETHMYTQFADFYTKRGLYDSALYYYDQCKNQGLLEPGIKSATLYKADLYYTIGKYQEAATMYNKGMDDYLDAYVLQGQNSISRWETTMRMQEKELQIVQSAEKRKKLIWMISGVVGIFIVTFTALIRQRALRKQLVAKNELISRQSQKLQQSLAEKELLLKEIHHRVKNNLQVINSLLDMHQANVEQPGQQNEAFVKARTHVHTIAMIHQNLYQQQDLSAVNMYAFVNDLFFQTRQLFHKTDKELIFENHIYDIKLDIDTAVPVGLILNELLTNTFKYVLPKVACLKLTITITATEKPENLLLEYNDNGPGMPEDIQAAKTGSLGMQLVKQLSRQIGGKLHYKYQQGSFFSIPFLTLRGRKEQD